MTKSLFLKQNLKPGEEYSGLMLGEKPGDPDYHLILLPGQAKDVNWSKAKEFAAKAGGELPTRREQRVLFANAKQHFDPNYYWSGEQHAGYSVYAWFQGFDDGSQYYSDKSASGRARAVRRLVIL